MSGYGSENKNTINIKKAIIGMVKDLNIKSILDAPCGDFNWIEKVLNEDLQYTGGDIVEELINKISKISKKC